MKKIVVLCCLLVTITAFCADTKKKPIQERTAQSTKELRYVRYPSTCPAAQPATHKRRKNTANTSLNQTPPQQNPKQQSKLSPHSSSTSVNSSWTKDDDSE